jgi:hypothetical protein
VTAFEVVIRLGRPFDVETHVTAGGTGRITSGVREITIPLTGGRESAEAALGEVQMSVRQVHDAGGEDYRPVVKGRVLLPGEVALPLDWESPDDAEPRG